MELPATFPCPSCQGAMTIVKQTYTCPDCNLQVWADPIGCGLVRYNIMPAEVVRPR
jgi:hypothetical protein